MHAIGIVMVFGMLFIVLITPFVLMWRQDDRKAAFIYLFLVSFCSGWILIGGYLIEKGDEEKIKATHLEESKGRGHVKLSGTHAVWCTCPFGDGKNLPVLVDTNNSVQEGKP